MNIRKSSGFTTLEILLVIIILGAVGFVGYYVYHAKNNTNSLYNSAAGTQIATKGAKKATTKTTTKTSAGSETIKPVISAALKENTAAAISSDNTAALEGYMTSSVNVVIAASEKTGAESATKAIMDLDYLSAGTDPWNFDLAAATLTTYKNGFYGQYFGTDTTIVGQSANNYVVSFGVNTSGKIDTVFMAASSDLLK